MQPLQPTATPRRRLRLAWPLAATVLAACAAPPATPAPPASPAAPPGSAAIPAAPAAAPQAANGSTANWSSLTPAAPPAAAAGGGAAADPPGAAPAMDAPAPPVTHHYLPLMVSSAPWSGVLLYDGGTGQTTGLLPGQGYQGACYIGHGHVLYGQGGQLYQYDLGTSQTAGFFAPQVAPMYQVGAFSASDDGSTVAFTATHASPGTSGFGGSGGGFGGGPFGGGFGGSSFGGGFGGGAAAGGVPDVYLWQQGLFAELSKSMVAAQSGGGVAGLGLSGDGRTLAFATGNGQLYVMAANGPLIEPLPEVRQAGQATQVLLNRDGTQVFWQAADGSTYRYDLTQHQNYGMRLPDGVHLASAGFVDGDPRLYYAAPNASGSLDVAALDWTTMAAVRASTYDPRPAGSGSGGFGSGSGSGFGGGSGSFSFGGFWH